LKAHEIKQKAQQQKLKKKKMARLKIQLATTIKNIKTPT
jgi:hypothetical protein